MSKEMTRVHENLGARKIHFSLANVNNSARLKEKWLKNHGFCSFKNKERKLVNEAANDSTRVSGQDRKKKPPALGTNQIAGFRGFRPLASVEKIKLFLLFNLLK